MTIKRITTRTIQQKAGLDDLTVPLPRHTEDELNKLIEEMIIEYFVNAQDVESYRMESLARRIGLTVESLNLHVYELLSRALKHIKEMEEPAVETPPTTGLLPSLDM